jgi:hypothetical protein
MTCAQETALPVIGQRGLWAGLEFVARRATQMGTDAYGHHELWLDRAVRVFGVFGRWVSFAVGGWIGQLTIELFQSFDLFGGAAHDPNGFAAPLNGELFTRLDVRNINFYSGSGGFCAL